MRDPLNNLNYVFKKRYERMMQLRRSPKLLLELYEHVHPDVTVNVIPTSVNLVVLFFCLCATGSARRIVFP